MSKLAVQLYTVREEAGKDFIGTLEKIAALGYEGVEFAGFFDIPANVLKNQLDRLGLTPVGSHTSIEQLVDHLDEVITYNKTIGNSNIVCPWSEVKDEESLELLVAQLKKVVQRLQDEDMILLYHNHDHEFKKIGENYLLDLLFEKCEGLYAEVVSQTGLLEQLQREYRVNVCGPSTMAALLNSLQMGFQSVAIQKHADEIQKVLSAVKTEFETYQTQLEKARSQVQKAEKALDTILTTRTNVMSRKLRTVTALENLDEAQKTLGISGVVNNEDEDEK